MYNTVTSEGFTNAPACPSTHPVRVPQVTFETVWDTTKFNSLWPSGGANPFVWSFEGSPTGYGTHADYMFGWKGDALQKAMDKSECFYDGCGSIKKQQMSVANQCTVRDFVGEPTEGCTYRGIQYHFHSTDYDRADTVARYGNGLGSKSDHGWKRSCTCGPMVTRIFTVFLHFLRAVHMHDLQYYKNPLAIPERLDSSSCTHYGEKTHSLARQFHNHVGE